MSFTAANLPKTLVTMDKIWSDAIAKEGYVAQVEAINALKKEQTASFSFPKDKDTTVTVTWIDSCDVEMLDCDEGCDNDLPELSATGIDYTLDLCAAQGFKVRDGMLRQGVFSSEEVVAKGMLKATKLMDEYLARAFVTSLNAHLGVNVDPTFSTLSAGTITEVPSANFNPSLMGNLIKSSILNRMSSPYILSGDNLFLDNWNASKDAPNADGKGNAGRMGALPLYFDLFNIDSTNTPNFDTYLIAKSAMAFASRARYDARPTQYQGAHVQYSVESRNIAGVRYDVQYKQKEEQIAGAGRCEIVHEFRLYTNAGFFLNPLSACATNRTGILKYRRGE